MLKQTSYLLLRYASQHIYQKQIKGTYHSRVSELFNNFVSRFQKNSSLGGPHIRGDKQTKEEAWTTTRKSTEFLFRMEL